MEVYELTQVKSYIEFPAETGQQKIPSVAEIQKGECTFAFRLSGYSGHCKWHFLGNFSVQPISVSVMSGDEPVCASVEPDSNSYETVYTFLVENASEITVRCSMRKLEQEETESCLRAEYGNKTACVNQLMDSERELQHKVARLQNERNELGDSLTQTSEALEEALKHAEDLQKRVSELEGAVAEQSVRNDSLFQKSRALPTAQEELKELRKSDREQRARLEQLEPCEEKARELDEIKGSRSWHMMLKVWAVRDAILPKGSRRRGAIKIVVRTVLHPLLTLKGRFRNPDLNALPIGAREIKEYNVPAAQPVQKKRKQDYAPFAVPAVANPIVSIVIPVYNEFDYTYHCIRSIVDHSGNIPLEVIVADDCSTDMTGEIQEIISGVVVVRNRENLRFLLNCNNAAKYARGKYLLFLNNDTQVGSNWLQPLVDLMEKDETIGMTGSKLVYPDGRLQEAGGIIFSDASGWNYGRMQDPAAPEYNYVKEVDYISGASIMIRTKLWKQLGGFDERFAPAYYEDTDLAFSVRKAGYKVVYQPDSVVTHFEGVSNGTDTSSGQKAYQEINRDKFRQKWKQVLEEEQCRGPQELFLARDRSQTKKRMLMVDHYVPTYDKDAGSRAIYSYLRLFVARNYQVAFIGDNFFAHQPYTHTLQQMGIEVLHGEYYNKNWSKWIQDYGQFLQYAFLSRPHIAYKYIDCVKKYSHAKIIYFGHDLCFLRERREYEVTKDPKFLQSSAESQERELSLMRISDVSYYPSCVEEQIVHQIDPDIKIRAVPLYQYEHIDEKPYWFDLRRDLMFIGGYSHRPNVDAAKWFVTEVLPLVVKEIPGIRIHLMGSNAPEEVSALAGPNVVFEGAVNEYELNYFYSTCRISVVPLRYGAGIKGKVLEAMSCGMPVMTTPIGAEGISGAENILCIAETAVEFAQKLAALYNDRNELERRSREGYHYIEENFSPSSVVRMIGQDFDMN